MLGHGDGTFDGAVGYFAGYFNVGLALGDVNGDGKSDIVTTSTNDSSVRVFSNNGDGTFGAAAIYAVGANPNGVALGDFNGDGALDIVTSNFYDYSNSATVLLNNGDGTFASGVPYVAGYSADKIAVGDLNGDGALDVAITNYYGGTVSVLMNNGDGTFATSVPYGIGGNDVNSVAIGDVNGDGFADIVAGSGYNSSFSAGNVSVLLNNGDGTFGAARNSDSGPSTNSVALGDLNGDGRLDLVTANLYSYSLSVFLNQSTPPTLELIAPDGVTVLASAEATDNVQAAFSNFNAPETGTYYLRVSGAPTVREYTLVATRDAVFDLGGNDATATAQPLGSVHIALETTSRSGTVLDGSASAAVSIARHQVLPEAPIPTEAEQVTRDAATATAAWDQCLADEAWTASLTVCRNSVRRGILLQSSIPFRRQSSRTRE